MQKYANNTDGWDDTQVESDKLIVGPGWNKNLSLEQRLELFDPAIHGGEVMKANLERA